MDTSHVLPLIPPSSSVSGFESIQSRILALDNLALRLSLLPTQSSWPARIPLNSRASVKGEVLSRSEGEGDQVKVRIGEEGWWIGMKFEEAAEWVKRKRDALLENQARLLEGQSQLSETQILARSLIQVQMPSSLNTEHIKFDTFFTHPGQQQQLSPLGSESKQPVRSSSERSAGSLQSGSQRSVVDQSTIGQSVPLSSVSSVAAETSRPVAESREKEVDVTDERNGSIIMKQDTDAQSIENLIQLVESLQDKLHLPPSGSPSKDFTVSNESVLSIHEIRETLDGKTLHGAPVPTEGGEAGIEIDEVNVDDYWSSEAKARREALRKRVFQTESSDEDEGEKDDDDDNEEDEQEDQEDEDEPKFREGDGEDTKDAKTQISSAIPSTIGARQFNPNPSFSTITEDDGKGNTTKPSSFPTSTDTSTAIHTPLPAPKSILKPPAPQKKSVSFDASIPLPPDSPPAPEVGLSKMGFRLPVEVGAMERNVVGMNKAGVGIGGKDEFIVKPVPVISEPKPPANKSSDSDGNGGGFAGFKRGFLVQSSKSTALPAQKQIPSMKPAQPRAKVGPAAALENLNGLPPKVAPTSILNQPSSSFLSNSPPIPAMDERSSTKFNSETTTKEAEVVPRKQSLFAQRRAAAAAAIQTAPALPKMSEAKPMATMKNAVTEKPPLPDSALTAKSATGTPSLVGPAKTVVGSYTTSSELGEGKREDCIQIEDDDQNDEEEKDRSATDEDDFGDLGEFSDDEEDEYDLDEALLAREVALEYHRRQAYQRQMVGDEEEVEEGVSGDIRGKNGVMLALPAVSSITGGGIGNADGDSRPLRIVNPTPDDLSQFLRVGRADDGSLVLEPPLVGSSSSESDGEEQSEAAMDRRKRRERRRDVKRRLRLGQYGEFWEKKEEEERELRKLEESRVREERVWRESVPPPVVGKRKGDEKVVEREERDGDGVNGTTAVASVIERIPPVVSDIASPSPEPILAKSVEESQQPQRKVSRFKAARQAQY